MTHANVTIEKFIACTDFPNLTKQKLALLEAIALVETIDGKSGTALLDALTEFKKKGIERKLEGLLTFLDNFEDMCEDHYGVNKKKLFKKPKKGLLE